MLRIVLRFLTQRVVITVLFMLIQAVLLIDIIWKLNNYFVYFYAIGVLLSLLMILAVINRKATLPIRLRGWFRFWLCRFLAACFTLCSAVTAPDAISEKR